MTFFRKPIKTSDLTGQVVVITGAGNGIGRELAVLCAARGADLALCDINSHDLEATADSVRAAGRDVVTHVTDVADAEQMAEFAGRTIDRFGGVDLVINNAGVGLIGGFLDTSLKDWDWLVSINLMGVVHGCDAFVPGMVERGQGGHIVNLSSAAGVLANPQLAAYSATKFAVFGLSEALRTELKPHGIGVTAVCPGIIDTKITETSPIRGDGNLDEVRQQLAKLYKKRGYPADRVARNILRAVDGNRAVAPIAAEAHIMYALSRVTPPVGRWLAGKMAAVAR